MLNVELPSDLDHRALVDQARMQIVNLSLNATVDLRRAERRAEDLSMINEELHDRAMRDKLTGLHNRRAFDEALAQEIESRACFGRQHCLGLVMIDVDRFNVFNDTYGHQAGDAVLGMVGEVLTRLTRKGDLAARYGGEEFALILPATTPAHLRAVAERVRTAIEAQVLEYEGRELRITASFGGACLQRSRGSGSGKALIQAADGCLYRAKAEGRNRSVVLESLLERGQAA
jgi:diguanylate cyclase (GGDEF)-like protein